MMFVFSAFSDTIPI